MVRSSEARKDCRVEDRADLWRTGGGGWGTIVVYRVRSSVGINPRRKTPRHTSRSSRVAILEASHQAIADNY